MSELEMAEDHLEHAAHAHAHPGGPSPRRAAVIVACLAAALAICETAARDAQTSFLQHHVAASDLWAEYQAKSGRRAIWSATAGILASLPASGEPDVRQRIDDARSTAERMRSEAGADGMEQLAGRAHAEEGAREHQEHRHRGLELAGAGLQLAIVLVSVSVVTGVSAMTAGGTVLGAVAAVAGLLAGLSLL